MILIFLGGLLVGASLMLLLSLVATWLGSLDAQWSDWGDPDDPEWP